MSEYSEHLLCFLVKILSHTVDGHFVADIAHAVVIQTQDCFVLIEATLVKSKALFIEALGFQHVS